LSVSGTGNVTLSKTTGNTDQSGNLVVNVTGALAGTATVKAQGLGTMATLDYTVTGPAAAVFAITAPADDPHVLATNGDITVTVNAPAPTMTVQFATTLGAWDGGVSSIVTKAVVAGTVSAVFKSTQAGLAAVQVSDAANSSLTDTVSIAVSAPASAAAQVTLQPSASVVAPSSTTIKNTVTLTATVRTSTATDSQVVGNAAVAFSIQNPTGGGGNHLAGCGLYEE
ncbi:MAG: hypothetical protein Q8K46_00010, partial [Deltaproteobacteria bacterium]|nr:hypothetical protein [Deltaproteobacteria bacterium]